MILVCSGSVRFAREQAKRPVRLPRMAEYTWKGRVADVENTINLEGYTHHGEKNMLFLDSVQSSLLNLVLFTMPRQNRRKDPRTRVVFLLSFRGSMIS